MWDLASSRSQGAISGPWLGSPGMLQRAAEGPGLVCTLQAKHARIFCLRVSRWTFLSAPLSFSGLGEFWDGTVCPQGRAEEFRLGWVLGCHMVMLVQRLGLPPLHTGASASETAAQTQWFLKAASVLGKMLTLAACISLALCSSRAELSGGPVTPSAPPFYSEQRKQNNDHLQMF